MKLTQSARGGYPFKHQAMLPSLIYSEGSTNMKIYSLKRFFILLIFKVLKNYIHMKKDIIRSTLYYNMNLRKTEP